MKQKGRVGAEPQKMCENLFLMAQCPAGNVISSLSPCVLAPLLHADVLQLFSAESIAQLRPLQRIEASQLLSSSVTND